MQFGPALLDRARSVPDYDHPNAGAEAAQRAATNLEANRIAIEALWPASAIALPDGLPELEYVYARDGALSARHVCGAWFGDVSVPRRAAERMLAPLEVAGSSAILLAPTHAQQIVASLAKLSERQSLIAVLPGEFEAGVMLACHDFSAAIRDRRLWPIVGPDWQRELDGLLEAQTGLAPAALMIRVPGLNETCVERMIKPCERVVNRHNQLHRHQLAMLQEKPRKVATPARRICVVTGRFKLWQAEAAILNEAAAASSLDCVTFDASRPDRASTLAFARAADGCDAILAANLLRSELPLAAPPEVAWTTLLTHAAVPAFTSAGPRDRLLVIHADQRTRALQAGWPADRVRLVHDARRLSLPAAHPTAVPALLLDLREAEMPKPVRELSSHAIVWERVRAAVAGGFGNLSAHASPTAFVAACAAAVGVPSDGLPIDLICETALLPSYARQLAITLARANVAFAIWGSGWEGVEGAGQHWRGPVTTLETFAEAVAGSSSVLDAWPNVAWHASRRCGRPVVRTWGRSPRQIEQDGRAAANPPPPSAESAPLAVELLAA